LSLPPSPSHSLVCLPPTPIPLFISLSCPPPSPPSRDLHSYLLGEQEDNEANQPVNNNNNNPAPGHHNNNPAAVVGEGLHAVHQAILQQGGPIGFQPYQRPLRFPFRIVLLIGFMCVTLLVASLVCLTLPGETWSWTRSIIY
uniref:RING-type E3 ubiquitin transferase n=1 Tax=Hucho hucho TaxID=62062 RepID=A0A4W5L784_9TELE